ncbi:glutathione S-transferase family protein [Guyparkeria hydrothermalis]|uniref:glutathione S-transferase family protein n=1 Tax=Guyparkeria hydrothermalis TaxID=923 RepID=UPI0020224B31|nr:glutathione S-transferase family protein [Guyparkeria hydrothermalis]MCL7743626.1 glutathione S-transferase family protein [Guyparkeria hydrothermalis]
MQLELISFKLCPFVQRSVITLNHKGVPFDTTFIRLDDLPDWFDEISPLGKVPVLKVDGAVLFESAVINEFLDESFGERMLSDDALERAQQRAWIEFGSACLFAMFGAITAPEEAGSTAKRQELTKLFGHLERQMAKVPPAPFFSGATLSLVDAAFAPLFQRLFALPESILDWDTVPTVKRWAERLVEEPVVRDSLPEGFDELFPMMLRKQNGWYARQHLPE